MQMTSPVLRGELVVLFSLVGETLIMEKEGDKCHGDLLLLQIWGPINSPKL